MESTRETLSHSFMALVVNMAFLLMALKILVFHFLTSFAVADLLEVAEGLSLYFFIKNIRFNILVLYLRLLKAPISYIKILCL